MSGRVPILFLNEPSLDRVRSDTHEGSRLERPFHVALLDELDLEAFTAQLLGKAPSLLERRRRRAQESRWWCMQNGSRTVPRRNV